MTHSNQTIPSTGGSDSRALLNPEMAAQPFDLWGHGVFEAVLDVPGFRGPGAMVLGAVTEFSPVTDKPIMGSAVITLHSVVPLDGPHVQVRVEVRWPEDLSIRVQLMWFL
ncbi:MULTISPECIES: hypothetical protein [unclassified Streptomyces]|uniref:hypothetical protein n=1 Tax=unclassified Streptomyces TaxID=2593676 RepID=UPI001E53A8C2|nr:hypothetical protein [Streptomyces sp. CB02980]MCB8906081.1 hypothetical protein [Streptomyces sp. CB02980]